MAYTKQTWLDRVGTFLNRFTKSNENLTSVELVNNPGTITQEGTAFSANRMNYMESGIENAHRIATPLSDLSRVMRINGDGVPMLPDDSASAIFQDFSSGWYPNQCTLTTVGGITTLVTTGADPFINKEFSFAGNANRFIRLIFDSPIDFQLDIYYSTSSHNFDGNYAKTVSAVVGRNVIDVDMGYLSVGGNDWFYSTITAVRFDFGPEAGRTFKIYGAYLGTLAYDTPAYGKDGQVVAVNHGAVPVNGPRGKGLLFQGKGATPLVFNGPVIGSTGTIRLKFKTAQVLNNGYFFGNNSETSGMALYQADTGANSLALIGVTPIFTIGSLSANTEYTVSISITSANISIFRNGTLLLSNTLSAPMTAGQSDFVVGRDTGAFSPGQDFTLYDFEYVAEAETIAEHIRFMNGDDAVDSQQKSVTPVPHSIVTRDANGGINASNMFAYDLVIDSDAKLAAWAASGTWEKVLVKKGTWTLASGGVDLTARGTKCVIGEPESKLVFSSAINGLYYTSTPTTKDYRMDGVTVETTGTGTAVGFSGCTNMTNCTGTGTGTGTGYGGVGFNNCTNITNCTGTGTCTTTVNGAGFSGCTNMTNCTGTGDGGNGYGFSGCTNMTNCTGTGTGTGTGRGFYICTKCQQNKAAGSTAKYYESYADAGTAYPCADTPNGGFNS